ncbi:MAG: hypothetical protein QM768_07490 [Agriterribacter sp.]
MNVQAIPENSAVVVINNITIRGILFVNTKRKVALFKNLFGSSTISGISRPR